MLSEIFYWALNASIIGGVIGLIVALLRKIPKLPRLAAYALWALPLIRLWAPFGIANRWSLLSLISRYATKTVVIWKPAPGAPDVSITNSILAAESYFPIVYKTDLLKTVFETASVVWAVAAAAAILTAAFLYALTKRELHGAKHLRDDVFVSDQIASPAVYGILRPKIVIPDWISERDLPCILTHERVHISRRDNLWRVAAIVTACVHWYNPLVWLFLQWCFADMELACDSRSLKTLGAEQARDYAKALLACVAGKRCFASAFGGAKTRMRIEHILSYQTLTLLSALAFGALMAAVSFVLMTNAAGG